MRLSRIPVLILIGLAVFCWFGPAAAQDRECTVITKIAGKQITLTPDNKNLQPFVIEIEDPAGLKVGDRVWVKDGQIVSCALPGRTPSPTPGKNP
jgi:hypothetical protein